MTVGDVAGLIAAIAFVLLVGLLAVPLVKLGRTLDETSRSIRELTEHSVPILDEAASTVSSTNDQLVKVDVITTSAAQVSENVSALAGLYASTLGRPLVKVAAFSYGVRQGLGKAWRSSTGNGASR
ncbi:MULTISPECIES: DUF948 domain-containing protein [Isoptericola]|uniref:DUF948 domain-containing protein n=1 Tax=Isoptericola sediminis TaxID=2733572 RepID=A0A849K9M8_9MICO|nr:MULTISPECIES: DUF948 domain-containing protein [Isoptericola]MDO8145049.1 DUF948 domain-containing protein [Isoptericola sp. 178]MDO8148683.1 DUF948 domain-containing protein [Isoptericola sp. b515]MDO8151371.1 DUF948 domain-containing protein [Isoptericola sp. b408]NNU28719.1 DUF948 domain-containing protein [Isoptericola sediminis]